MTKLSLRAILPLVLLLSAAFLFLPAKALAGCGINECTWGGHKDWDAYINWDGSCTLGCRPQPPTDQPVDPKNNYTACSSGYKNEPQDLALSVGKLKKTIPFSSGKGSISIANPAVPLLSGLTFNACSCLKNWNATFNNEISLTTSKGVVPISATGHPLYSGAGEWDNPACKGIDFQWVFNSENFSINYSTPDPKVDGVIGHVSNFKLNPPLSLSSSDEDKLISGIDKDKSFGINVGNAILTHGIPATNCVHLSGNGPRKIVFMRGNQGSEVDTVAKFLWHVTDIIDYGFKKVDPFKTYFSQFSFYVDLKKVDQISLPTWACSIDDCPMDNFTEVADSMIRSNSSCGVNGSEYIVLFSNSTTYPAYVNAISGTAQSVVYLNLHPGLPSSPGGGFNFSIITQNPAALPQPQNLPRVALHETAHALAQLNDEYGVLPIGLEKNCVTSPLTAFRNSTDGKIYANIQPCNDWLSKDPKTSYYYKPSTLSIMNVQSSGALVGEDQFNVISCGYLVAALKGESLTQASAAKYWPGCLKMKTVPVAPLTSSLSVKCARNCGGSTEIDDLEFPISCPLVAGGPLCLKGFTDGKTHYVNLNITPLPGYIVSWNASGGASLSDCLPAGSNCRRVQVSQVGEEVAIGFTPFSPLFLSWSNPCSTPWTVYDIQKVDATGQQTPVAGNLMATTYTDSIAFGQTYSYNLGYSCWTGSNYTPYAYGGWTNYFNPASPPATVTLPTPPLPTTMRSQTLVWDNPCDNDWTAYNIQRLTDTYIDQTTVAANYLGSSFVDTVPADEAYSYNLGKSCWGGSYWGYRPYTWSGWTDYYDFRNPPSSIKIYSKSGAKGLSQVQRGTATVQLPSPTAPTPPTNPITPTPPPVTPPAPVTPPTIPPKTVTADLTIRLAGRQGTVTDGMGQTCVWDGSTATGKACTRSYTDGLTHWVTLRTGFPATFSGATFSSCTPSSSTCKMVKVDQSGITVTVTFTPAPTSALWPVLNQLANLLAALAGLFSR